MGVMKNQKSALINTAKKNTERAGPFTEPEYCNLELNAIVNGSQRQETLPENSYGNSIDLQKERENKRGESQIQKKIKRKRKQKTVTEIRLFYRKKEKMRGGRVSSRNSSKGHKENRSMTALGNAL